MIFRHISNAKTRHALSIFAYGAIVLAMMLMRPPAAHADNTLYVGDEAGETIEVRYCAIDKVRHQSKFGSYPLPSPDDPLRFDGRVGSIPPTQRDIDRYYRDFKDYELLDVDYYNETLTYYYTWRYGTSREEAAAALKEELDSRSTETIEEMQKTAEKFAEADRLREAGEHEKAQQLEDEIMGIEPMPEDLIQATSQEELMREALVCARENLEAARARNDTYEIAHLEREIAQIEKDLAYATAIPTDEGAVQAEARADSTGEEPARTGAGVDSVDGGDLLDAEPENAGGADETPGTSAGKNAAAGNESLVIPAALAALALLCAAAAWGISRSRHREEPKPEQR